MILLRQQGTVRKKIHLAPSLVGPDIGVGTDGTHHIHGDILVLVVPDGDDIRVDVLDHLPAGGALPAGPGAGAGALKGGGGIAGSVQTGGTACKHQGMGQGVPGSRPPDADGCRVFRRQGKGRHRRPSSKHDFLPPRHRAQRPRSCRGGIRFIVPHRRAKEKPGKSRFSSFSRPSAVDFPKFLLENSNSECVFYGFYELFFPVLDSIMIIVM